MNKWLDILMLSNLSCSSMYFLGAFLTKKSFDTPLTYVMLLGFILGVLHLLEKSSTNL